VVVPSLVVYVALVISQPLIVHYHVVVVVSSLVVYYVVKMVVLGNSIHHRTVLGAPASLEDPSLVVFVVVVMVRVVYDVAVVVRVDVVVRQGLDVAVVVVFSAVPPLDAIVGVVQLRPYQAEIA
jgi:hypothetical protein